MKRGPRGPYKTKKKVMTTEQTDQPNDSVNLHGLQLDVDTEFLKRLKEERLKDTKRQFRETVLPKFVKFLDEQIQNSKNSREFTDSVKISNEIGEAIVNYSRVPEGGFTFTPGHEYPLRTHISLVTVMEWSINRILTLEKQISDLNSKKVNSNESRINAVMFSNEQLLPKQGNPETAHTA